MSGHGDAPAPGGGVLRYFVRHRTAANIVLALMVIAGIYAGSRIRAQFFPDVFREGVTVSVAWPGAGAEDMDTGVVALIEPELLGVEGVADIVSSSREGSTSITLEFEEGWDVDRGAEDVKTAVEGLRGLPEGAETPVIRRANFRDRVTDVMISGGVGLERLADYAEEFRARLLAEGVTRTSVSGLSDPVMEAQVSEAALMRYGVSIDELAAAIAAATSSTPAGQIEDAARRLRVGEPRKTAREIADAPLRAAADGGRLYVRDVARVTEKGLGSGLALYSGGEPAVALSVYRSATGDAIRLQAKVEAAAAEFAPTLPAGVRLELVRTRAQAIKDRLNLLVDNGVSGLFVVVALLVLFLNGRTAFWVAAGIPVSMAATIALMYAMGASLNMVSLFALIISLGIIVDDAIVVGEHADALARRGLSPAEAAARAAERMAAPVFAASLTTIVAFMGLTNVGGFFGRMIMAIPITVSIVLVASLLESFVILPAHMRHALGAKNQNPWWDAPSRLFNAGFSVVRDGPFRALVRLCARYRYVVLAGAVGALLATLALTRSGDVPFVFFTSPERGSVQSNIVMQDGATRAETFEMLEGMRRAAEEIDAKYQQEHGRPLLISVLSQVGGAVGWGARSLGDVDPDLLGAVEIEMIDPDLRPDYPQRDFMRDWLAATPRHPRLDQIVQRGLRSGGGGDAIDVKLSGADAATLKASAETLKQALGAFPEVSALDDTLAYDKDELLLTLTPRGEALGFTAASLGRELRKRLEGVEAAKIVRDGRQIAIRVTAPEGDIGADYLYQTRLTAPGGAVVGLSEIVSVESRRGFSSIRRENGVRLASVTGDIEDNPDAELRIREQMEQVLLPGIAQTYGVRYSLGGRSQQEAEFLRDAMTGYMLCVAAIYLILAWIFGSWTRPVVVMLVIPFGAIGVIWGHYAHDTPLSMYSIVGFVGMSGIIINDSIVLVGAIDEHAEKRGLFPSIVDGAADRLRAVLLTSLTTIGGLAPLLFEKSTQAQFLKPTAITLAWGLGFGVVLVLILTPALIAIENDLRMGLRAFWRWRKIGRRKGLGGGGRPKTQTPDTRTEPTLAPPEPAPQWPDAENLAAQ